MQPQWELRLLAFLREERFRKQQDDDEKTKSEKDLAGDMETAHLERSFEDRNGTAAEVQGGSEHKAAGKVEEPLG